MSDHAATPDPAVDTDREKLRLEHEKLTLERQKMKWSALSVGVPLVVASLSIGATVFNQASQARAQFRLKAAELVVNTDDPLVAKSRAEALQALFPDELDRDFVSRFPFANYTGTALNDRIKIAGEVIQNPAKRKEILLTYLRAYEQDPWLEQWLSE